MSIGTSVPSKRNNTMTAGEVHRKSFEELMASAFTKDQLEVLNSLISGADESSAITQISVSINKLTEDIEALALRVAALEPASEPESESENEG